MSNNDQDPLAPRIRAYQDARDRNTPEPPNHVMRRAHNGTLTPEDLKQYADYFNTTTQGRKHRNRSIYR